LRRVAALAALAVGVHVNLRCRHPANALIRDDHWRATTEGDFGERI
jgi:hypothetical protein